MATPLFRDTALRSASSLEQLDRLTRVTALRGWLALAAFATVLAAALGWSIWGSVPTRVYGSGVLLRRGGGIVEVQARAAGRLREIRVRAGQRVEPGQVIAVVEQSDRVAQLGQARDLAAALRTQRAQTERYHTDYLARQQRNLADQARSFAQQGRNAEADLATQQELLRLRARDAEARVRVHEALLSTHEDLLREGVVSQLQVEAEREKVQGAREDLGRARTDGQQVESRTRETLARLRDDTQKLETTLLELQHQRTQALEALDLKILDAEQRVRALTLDVELSTGVESPARGTVVEVVAASGMFVGDRAPIVRVETGEQRLEAIVYTSAGPGKEIKPGMTAHLTPATVKREEYGSIVGRVLSVGAAPSTAAGMMAVLDNRELVTSLTQAGPQLAVGVELEPDTSAASGYRWSSGRGPAITIGSGTLATGEFVVRREPPIALVIPALKKFLGLD